MRPSSSLEQVVEWLGPRDDFAIASHADPDGDSLGSSLALAFALEQVGKRSTVVIGQSLPRRYRWLPGASRVVSTDRVPPDARASILVECSDFGRSGVAGLDTLESLNIDHHTKNLMYADINWIEPSAAATGMMIHGVAEALGAEVTPQMAALLYVTVLTDTGSFQHSNTDARAMRFASDMLAFGAKASEISEAVYGDYPAARIHLMGDALSSLERVAGGRIAYMFLPFSAFERRGTRDTEAFVNHVQGIDGVKVSMLFKEVEPGVMRISIRSDGSVDVAEIASHHGGGGHPRAAGCQIEGPVEAARQRLIDEIHEELDAGNHA
jgi:phosphoesterase RecJ-like protein